MTILRLHCIFKLYLMSRNQQKKYIEYSCRHFILEFGIGTPS